MTLEALIQKVRPKAWEWFYLHTYGKDLWYAEVGIQDSKDGLIQHTEEGKTPKEAVEKLLERIAKG